MSGLGNTMLPRPPLAVKQGKEDLPLPNFQFLFASFRCGGMKIPVYWAICYPDGRKRFLGYEKQRKRICATQTASSAAPKLNRNRPTQYLKSMRCPPYEPTHIKRWVFLCSTVFCLAVGSLVLPAPSVVKYRR